MPALVIVTDQCYLICESINFITVNDRQDQDRDSIWSTSHKNKRKFRSLKEKRRFIDDEATYSIVINFIPEVKGAGVLSKKDTAEEVNISVKGRKNCLSLYKEMVSQIREQLPDQLYLDKMVEKILQHDQPKD